MQTDLRASERSSIGEFEELVLLAVRRLGGSAYSQSIRQALAPARGRPVSLGALYVTLDRLGQKGLVCSRLGEPQPVRGGRARRYYAITPQGERSLQNKAAARSRFERSLLGLAAQA
jgi:PadR family transcriptional regulator, regulatory protein PadR